MKHARSLLLLMLPVFLQNGCATRGDSRIFHLYPQVSTDNLQEVSRRPSGGWAVGQVAGFASAEVRIVATGSHAIAHVRVKNTASEIPLKISKAYLADDSGKQFTVADAIELRKRIAFDILLHLGVLRADIKPSPAEHLRKRSCLNQSIQKGTAVQGFIPFVGPFPIQPYVLHLEVTDGTNSTNFGFRFSTISPLDLYSYLRTLTEGDRWLVWSWLESDERWVISRYIDSHWPSRAARKELGKQSPEEYELVDWIRTYTRSQEPWRNIAR